jgi:translocation and assembly module TamA
MASLACGFFMGLTVLPAGAAYRLEIDAPKALAPLLAEHLDLARYQKREDLSEEQLNFLLATVDEQVRQLASTEGYFATVATATLRNDDAQKVVHLQVKANDRTLISTVDLYLVGAAAQETPSRLERMQKNWQLPVGSPFTQKAWDGAKEEVLQRLQARRFAAAKIMHSEASIDPVAHQAELAVQYDSGPVFTLGQLRVSGTRRYPETIIHHVNPLVVGEEYSVERLLELQRQIQATPYFSNVVIDIDNDPNQALLTPVRVHVTEFPAQRIRAGAGYASDTGAHIEGRYSHYNVFDRALVLDAQTKIEQKRQFGALSLAMPPDEKGYVNSVRTSFERTTLQGADLRSLRAGLQRARAQEKVDVAYSLDYYQDELQQSSGAVLSNQTSASPGKHQALVPGFSWTRRDIDNPVFPRRGNVVSVQAGFALKGLLTDQSFVRTYAHVRQYMPVSTRDLMIFRGELGMVLSKGGHSDVPASLLFRAGGTDSIRGYGYQSIGNAQNGTVYPTKYLLTAGAEYQHWFSGQWGSAVFYDVGSAADNLAEKTIYQGIGVGARWRSPVGPVNVDVAYGVQGGKIRPHISLGVAF